MRFHHVLIVILMVASGKYTEIASVTATSIYDIPGVPLTRTSISSDIGGATYDHVYSLQVQAGTVLLVTLQGEAQAELGLYLFDSDATSVYVDEPFATSALPGADQTISTQFFRDSIVYINVNGRNVNRPYTYQLNVSAVVDVTPPVIRDVKVQPHSRPESTCVTINAADGLSGVQSVAILQEFDTREADWIPYVGARQYCSEIQSEDGVRDIVVAVRNKIGLISFKSAGMTLIDSIPPRLLRAEPADQVTFVQKPVIQWRFSEPIRSTNRGSSRVLAVTQTGDRIAGYVWTASDRRSMFWEPIEPISVGTQFTVVPALVVDRAGNLIEMIEPVVLVRKVRTKIELEIVRAGAKTLVLAVRSSRNLVGETVVLSERLSGEWIVSRSLTITGVSMQIKVSRNSATRLQAVWVGSDRLGASRASISGRPLVP